MKFSMIRFIATFVLLISSSVSATIIADAGYTDSLFLSGVGSWGSMAHASNGDVYYSRNGIVFKYDGTNTTSISSGLGLEVVGNELYIGGYNTNTISTYNLSTGAISVIGNVAGSYINGFAVGNSGELIVAASNGVYEYDLSNNTSSNIWGQNGPISDVIFNNDGELFASNYYQSGLVQLFSDGSVNNFDSVNRYIDNFANYLPTGEIFMANSIDNRIDILNSDKSVSNFATQTNFNGGWYPSPLSFNADYTKLYYADGNDMRVISGFEGITAEVPEPSTLAIFALGMIGLASRRFKKQS